MGYRFRPQTTERYYSALAALHSLTIGRGWTAVNAQEFASKHSINCNFVHYCGQLGIIEKNPERKNLWRWKKGVPSKEMATNILTYSNDKVLLNKLANEDRRNAVKKDTSPKIEKKREIAEDSFEDLVRKLKRMGYTGKLTKEIEI